jgi:hypothetical protein
MSKVQALGLRSQLTMVVCIIATLGLIGCSSSSKSDDEPGASPMDGIYEGTIEGMFMASEEELEENEICDPPMPGFGCEEFADVTALIGNGRAILFSDLPDDETDPEFGADVRVSVVPVQELGEITGFTGSASGTVFEEGEADAPVTVTSLVVESVTEYPHLPPLMMGGDPESDIHPDGFVAEFMLADDEEGDGGTYTAEFIAELYNLPSDLAFLANRNTMDEPAQTEDDIFADIYVGQEGLEVEVLADGSFESDLLETEMGECELLGELTLLDANHNLYRVDARIVEENGVCASDEIPTGTYSGLAFAELGEDPELAVELVIAVTGGSGEDAPFQFVLNLERVPVEDDPV